jgi:hypothetical protein
MACETIQTALVIGVVVFSVLAGAAWLRAATMSKGWRNVAITLPSSRLQFDSTKYGPNGSAVER